MKGHRVGDDGKAWLRDNYARGTIDDTLDAFEREFGWRPTRRTVYVMASRMGLRKELNRQDPRIRTDRAQVRIRWSDEPEMSAWMANHASSGFQDVVEGFEAEFGIRLSRGQVNQFRAANGIRNKPGKGGRERKPVGAERETKGGILVKVAPEATVPMSKDNWRFKHHLAYEAAYGPIPEGHQVWAVDGDTRNCDPDNLVAVDRRLVGAINQARSDGRLGWHDRESMLACVALAALEVGINDADHALARRCGVCGEPFVEPEDKRRWGKRAQTCPGCLAQGKRARGDRGDKRPTVCAVCGEAFARTQRNQRRCPECIAAKPRHGVREHAGYYKRNGRR